MFDTKGTKLIKGDKVRLTHPDPAYDIGRYNPIAGTIHECIGTYIGAYEVEWGKGIVNGYQDYEVTLVTKHTNSVGGKYKSIWE